MRTRWRLAITSLTFATSGIVAELDRGPIAFTSTTARVQLGMSAIGAKRTCVAATTSSKYIGAKPKLDSIG
jgi:hypothetical protein